MALARTLTFQAVDDPAGVEVRDAQGAWLATFTNGARTVRLRGATRTFSEPTAESVTHATWVRTLIDPFDGTVDDEWLSRALDANRSSVPDILAISMQYIVGAPPILDGDLQIAGDASYGPPTGKTREEGSDFYDYLGIRWTDPDGKTHKPREDQLGCLDCSGFMRMTWGYRDNLSASRIPLSLTPLEGSLPRRAVQICDHGPGVVVIANAGTRPRDLSALKVGDLVFFDADPNDGPAVDHVGMYLGRDARHQRRFISSRKSADGPTFGDFRHASTLDGDPETDLYTRSFRAVRRL